MSRIDLLKIAYVANILILVPVVHAMLLGGTTARVFEDRVADSAGLRIMVGSLWAAILLASIAGLGWPQFFAPVLLIQIVYKALWLVLFVAPVARRTGLTSIPFGISATFLAIVLTYPIIFWITMRSPAIAHASPST
jgi:hypothetical protein